jgi:hypothetical protein
MLTQLNPPIPLEVVGMGPAAAVAVIDYGPDYDLLWVCFIDATRECWTVSNKKVKALINYTMGRTQ